ncbi:MAG TPA: valine--tRNA ligase [Verrucomicrobiae bacterium]|nr:valine--tRNA ligase [Verrucomicrobiae bacterium]
MSEISKTYEPQSVEDKWYQFWLDGKFFVANEKSAKPAYSIVIPPPNVTGVLTMGHVLNNTIQDILARKARMDGKEVLWLPGTDHAGIATQTVVERTLKKSGEIKHRDDLGRDKFLERVWQWKEKHGGIIIQQLKKLGASCDWTRERFTMDEAYSRCVQKVFVELYKKGLIYRGKRMVNWCPATLTALSDEEVVMKEQRGSLYYFKVQVAESPLTPALSPDGGEGEKRAATPTAVSLSHSEEEGQGEGDTSKFGPITDSKGRIWLTIATTRPETIPGDTAVAVNPKDPRYAKFIGQHVIRPLPAELPREQKLIPIIGDEHVDFEFGTGVLKVTPAHDKADFEIGTRHHLPAIEVIDARGQMNDAAGADLRGLDRFKARKVAAEKLAEFGALEKEEPYTNNIGYSERADVPIEPRLSEQWFLKYPSAEKSRAVVDSGRMKFHPERWAKVYDHWMGGLQDWCISRQLWWGHRIPVWSKSYADRLAAVRDEDEINRLVRNRKDFVVRREPEIKFAEDNDKPCRVFICVAPDGSADSDQSNLIRSIEQLGFTQDPDVLDTWFSSWLWPFATMGWPEQTDTLKKFYPTTDLVTGPDIIFFWVARMIMAGYEFMGEMPFKNVYFTGIIRDKQGRKMSKSLGNSPDPLDLIAKFGADALRFGVMRAAPLGQDILFDEQNVELGRNFCNKLWNACRFRQMQGGEVQGEIDPKLLTSDDKWILLKLDAAIRELNTAFAEYKFSDATATLYRFFWNEYCDWYVEASKSVFFGNDAAQKANSLAVIDFVLSHTLRLFHPFIPFVSEELWHGMGYATDMPENQGGKTIMFAPWPKPLDDEFTNFYGLSASDEKFAESRNNLVVKGRNLRREANLPASKKIRFVFKPVAGQMAASDVEVLKLLLNAETVEVNANFAPGKNVLAVRHELGELFLPLEGLIDVEAERARIKKEIEKYEAEIVKVEQKLANPNFAQKVPPAVLEEHKQRLGEWQNKLAQSRSALAALQN